MISLCWVDGPSDAAAGCSGHNELTVGGLKVALASGRAAIVGLNIGSGHAVVVDQITGGAVSMRDPAVGEGYSVPVSIFEYEMNGQVVSFP